MKFASVIRERLDADIVKVDEMDSLVRYSYYWSTSRMPMLASFSSSAACRYFSTPMVPYSNITLNINDVK